MLLLAAAAAPVALTLLNGRSLREASSSTQAMLAGARDRAAASREPRGVRLIPDANNPSLVRELRFIRPSTPVDERQCDRRRRRLERGSDTWNDFTVPFPPGATVGPTPIRRRPGSPTPRRRRIRSSAWSCCSAATTRSSSAACRTAWPETERVYFGVIRLATSGQLLGFSTTDAMIDHTSDRTGVAYPLLRLDQPLTRPYPFDDLRAGRLPYRSGYNAGGMQPRRLSGDDRRQLHDSDRRGRTRRRNAGPAAGGRRHRSRLHRPGDLTAVRRRQDSRSVRRSAQPAATGIHELGRHVFADRTGDRFGGGRRAHLPLAARRDGVDAGLASRHQRPVDQQADAAVGISCE